MQHQRHENPFEQKASRMPQRDWSALDVQTPKQKIMSLS